MKMQIKNMLKEYKVTFLTRVMRNDLATMKRGLLVFIIASLYLGGCAKAEAVQELPEKIEVAETPEIKSEETEIVEEAVIEAVPVFRRHWRRRG